MLRNKEPELAENNDSSFGWFDPGFYRVRFVTGRFVFSIVNGVKLGKIASGLWVSPSAPSPSAPSWFVGVPKCSSQVLRLR